MPTNARFAAADLGASSGRVIVGELSRGVLQLQEAHRFANGPQQAPDGSFHWDFSNLRAQVRTGFSRALELANGDLAALGVDTWGVDYGRVDAHGHLQEDPYCYRDRRTDGISARVAADLGRSTVYQSVGIQDLPFNTAYQLLAHTDNRWDDIGSVLMIPDLLIHDLTGERLGEVTNWSTAAMIDPVTRTWSPTLLNYLKNSGVPVDTVLPVLREPGQLVAETSNEALGQVVPMALVASHDTASAVVAVPSTSSSFAYISSGTWSLVGLELDAPVLTAASQAADFTNELGVDGTVRYLKNLAGLWPLQVLRQQWAQQGQLFEWGELVEMAAAEPALQHLVDMNDDRLIPPGDMLSRLQLLADERGRPLSSRPSTVARCVLDSLALAYRSCIRRACALSGRTIDTVHVVGGGSLNPLLCQLTADATSLRVVAGPAEATALGNLLMQARATGHAPADLWQLREISMRSSDYAVYWPSGGREVEAAWDAAEACLQAPTA